MSGTYWSGIINEPKDLANAALDPAVILPDWEDGGRVHNWRNHVGEHAKRIWPTLTAEQKAALALDADISASAEDWD